MPRSKKLSQLPAATIPAGAVELVCNQGGTTKKLTVEGLDQIVLTSDMGTDPDHLAVKQVYVSKSTGNLVIVFEDGQE